VTSRLAVLRKGRGHPVPQDGGRRRKPSLNDLAGAALGGDLGRGVRGSVDRAVVLVDRIDCRSRHAAHGPRDPGRIARAIVEDLASPCESIGGVNARRKPEHGGKAVRSVAGAACECGRSTCRGKALRAGKAVSVDAGAVEAVLAPRCCSVSAGRARGATGSVRGLVISFERGRKSGVEAAPKKKRGPVSFFTKKGARRIVSERAEAGGTPSSVTPLGAGLPKGGPTPCSRRHSGLNPPDELRGGGRCSASCGLGS
jgi:hypothetical protein